MQLYDLDIRDPLFWFLEEKYVKMRFMDEIQIGKSRADVVLVTDDAVFGLEIKSDADTYARLKSQVRDYNKYFDYNYVVVGKSHAKHIDEHVPKFWGIIVCSSKGDGVEFEIVREPLPNPKFKLEKKMSLLWRRELTSIASQCLRYKYTSISKPEVCKKLIEGCDKDKLNRLISTELFNRDYTTI